MQGKKAILIVVFNTIDKDVRVLRQLHTLKTDYNITLLSFGGTSIEGITMINLKKSKMTLVKKLIGLSALLTGIFSVAYRCIHDYIRQVAQLSGHSFDLILANDIETLPLAFFLKKEKTKVLFDAHEFALLQFDNDWKWRLLFKRFNKYLSDKYIPKVDEMITQNRLFADEFRTRYGVNPLIMTNAPEWHEIEPHETNKNKIKIIHHGIYNATRKIDRLLDVIDLLDDAYSLTLMLHCPAMANENSKAKYEEFLEKAKNHPKVIVREAVAGSEVVKSLQNYDIGVHILEPINFNHAYSLPNKILEFVQARLASVIGPSPGMVDIVERYELGKVAIDFSAEEIASTIRKLTVADIDHFKAQSHKYAYELSSENNRKMLLETVSGML